MRISWCSAIKFSFDSLVLRPSQIRKFHSRLLPSSPSLLGPTHYDLILCCSTLSVLTITTHRKMPGPIRGAGNSENEDTNRPHPYFGPPVPLHLRPRRDGSLPTVRSAPPQPPRPWSNLKNFMPKVGMKYKHAHTVTKRTRRDRAIWYAVMDTCGLFFKARHLQETLTEVINIAADHASKRKPPADFVETLGDGDGLTTADATLQFLRSVRESHLLARKLSPSTFAELFGAIFEAREAYLADPHKYVDWHPNSPLVDAVDRFLAVSWFWDGMHLLLKMESEHEEVADDNETTEEQDELESDGEEAPVARGTAVSSLVAEFDGCSIWTLSTSKFVDDDDLFADVDPLTDDEEDEVMGGTHCEF
ncbi:hypothetical protein B0T20DRAFT_435398 [Sordaria brevicollis]|uniref:Uncharacterized protein n=1 Tax=Sordaria brevicollis TaxID=83679 RepID=A0AAE0PI71_SORBR|nr:hypothetical protein B0T20DRAFT_435398 [Sordaria brevicollis]